MTAKKYFKADKQQAYEHAMSEVVRYITAQYKASVIFIPQVTANLHDDDDRNVHANICGYLGNLPNIYNLKAKMDVNEIYQVYKELDLMIGTRFHSVIFSLTSFVPAIAIEYEHKTSGIMRDLQLEEWTVNINNLWPEKVNALFDKLIADRMIYANHLKKKLPPYTERAHAPIRVIARLYDERYIKAI